MSQSNVAKVREMVASDPALQQRLAAAKGDGELVQVLRTIGTEKGLPFTEQDLEMWKSGEGSSVELDEAQLQQVAGGFYGTSYGNSILCGFCGATSGSWIRTVASRTS